MISSFCLPPELQVEIVDYLHPKDLANVARLCQSWSEIALDALWSQQPISIWLLIELLMNPVDPNLYVSACSSGTLSNLLLHPPDQKEINPTGTDCSD